MLNKNYSFLKNFEDIIYWNVQETKRKRIENANYIMNNIKQINKDILYFKDLRTEDIPLFIPINIKNPKHIQNNIAKKGIYLPIHWPKSNYIDSKNKLFENELSIICDQRYSIRHMEYIILNLKNELI